MKITDKLVQLVNARLQDLKFEIDTVGYLQNIEEDSELSNDFANLDISIPLDNQYAVVVSTEGEEVDEIPYELRTMYTIKRILADMGQKDSQGIIRMVADRSGVELNTLKDLVELYESTENDIKHVLQTDVVAKFLANKGLNGSTSLDIDIIKNKVLQSVFEVLGINSEELK